jgi:hypothetical protein
VVGYKPAVRGCCRFIGFTTTAYLLRVRGQVAGYPANAGIQRIKFTGFPLSRERQTKKSPACRAFSIDIYRFSVTKTIVRLRLLFSAK